MEISTHLITFYTNAYRDVVSTTYWVAPVWQWRRFYPENFLAWLGGDRRRLVRPPATFDGWFQMIVTRDEWITWDKVEEVVEEMHMAVREGNEYYALWCSNHAGWLLKRCTKHTGRP